MLLFPVRGINGWSLVFGPRDVYRVVCMNAGVKRGARLASLPTPWSFAALPPLIIRRASPNEKSATSLPGCIPLCTCMRCTSSPTYIGLLGPAGYQP